MQSGVFVLPAALRSAGNAFAISTGWGPNVYSVPLSPTGEEPATHYGCRADLSPAFFEMLADPPAEAAPLLAALVLDHRDAGGDPFGHWSEVIAAQGLQVVQPEDIGP